MKELVKEQLLEKIPEGRGRPNRLYILFPDEEQGQKFAVGNPTGVGQKNVGNYGGNQSPSKYISNNGVSGTGKYPTGKGAGADTTDTDTGRNGERRG